MKLLVVLASVRDGRMGKKVADWFTEQVETDGRFEIDSVDLKELNLSYELPEKLASQVEDSHYDREEDTRWAARVNEADAVVFVSPEYNHGYPASLKNAVDHLYHEWNGKPAAFVGYGAAGAVYSQSAFALVAAWIHLNLINARVGIPEIWSAFDESGKLTHADYHNYEAKTVLDSLAAKVEIKS